MMVRNNFDYEYFNQVDEDETEGNGNGNGDMSQLQGGDQETEYGKKQQKQKGGDNEEKLKDDTFYDEKLDESVSTCELKVNEL